MINNDRLLGIRFYRRAQGGNGEEKGGKEEGSEHAH
jgi:hypothetical protein